MATIEMKLDQWSEQMKAEGYSDEDIFFAITVKHQVMGDEALVEEARQVFGQKAADELAELRASQRRAYRAACLRLS